MTREQAEQIARKHANAGGSYYEMLTDRCVDAIMEAAAVEREACAKHIDVPYVRTGSEFADAIRARGE